jgi:hypothetical protein
MLVKTYWMTWLAVAAAAGIIFLGGGMTMFVLVVFGFIAFGLTFMGLISILPSTVSHPIPEKEKTEKPADKTFLEKSRIHRPVHSAHA